MLFVLIGPSSSGKDTILRTLLDRTDIKLEELPLITTRPMRDGESQYYPYYFTNTKSFLSNKRVVEYRVYNTALGDWYYGTMLPKNYSITKDYITVNTIDGYKQILDVVTKRNDGSTVIPLYIQTEDKTRLLRSIDRGGNLVEICRRFIADCSDFDDIKVKEIHPEVFDNNDKLPTDEIVKFIKSCKVHKDLA